jgi:hypothetical protein
MGGRALRPEEDVARQLGAYLAEQTPPEPPSRPRCSPSCGW